MDTLHDSGFCFSIGQSYDRGNANDNAFGHTVLLLHYPALETVSQPTAIDWGGDRLTPPPLANFRRANAMVAARRARRRSWKMPAEMHLKRS